MLMERIADTPGDGRSLVFGPWQEVPGLVQGVSLRPREGEQEVTASGIEARLRSHGVKNIARVTQVHGKRVLDTGTLDFPLEELPRADGLAGREPGVVGVITVADCVPVFILHRHSLSWAILHAGWRGTVAGVLPEALRMFESEWAIPPNELEIYLGPSIYGACYEVGEDVARLAGEVCPECVSRDAEGRFFADLRRALSFQAEEAGVSIDRLRTSSYCTLCHDGLFYSYRGEGERALKKMWAWMGISRKK